MNINEKSFYFEHVERLNLQHIKNILDFSSPVGKDRGFKTGRSFMSVISRH